ncbi:MAG TPA: extracellular solute-binding protein [Galbitalea sp.]|jgi:ABC-type glycerol-3-phosphate transport system substrate-binding protein|nr:extracellular solute-binding protein [Galbitalea sp.]
MSRIDTPHATPRIPRRIALVAVATVAALSLAACAPGSGGSGSSTPGAIKTDLGTKATTLNVLVTTPDVALFDALGKAFHAKYPNVKVNVQSQDYTSLTTNISHVLSGTNVPDVVRIASFGNLVKDKLLLNLDPYASAYGWTKWPQSQFASTRVAANGTQRGSGSLYGVGPGFGLTGVYYNKALAQQVGMTTAPTSLAAFEKLMAKAKAAGITPIIENGKDGGTGFILQNLQMDYAGSIAPVQKWNEDVQGASIDSSATVEAATTMQQWAKDGYFAPDVNAVDQTLSPTQFTSGQGLFFPSGNWQAPGLDSAGAGKFGFFLFPPTSAGGEYSAMTSTDTVAVPAKATHPAAAAAFLNFIQTDAIARQDTVNLGGVVPAGPVNGSTPTTKSGSVVGATVSAFRGLLKSDGLADFMANATASINANAIIPQTQLLVAGQTTPQNLAKTLQSDYTQELAQ